MTGYLRPSFVDHISSLVLTNCGMLAEYVHVILSYVYLSLNECLSTVFAAAVAGPGNPLLCVVA